MVLQNPTVPIVYQGYNELHALYYRYKKSEADAQRYEFYRQYVKEVDGEILDAVSGIGAYLIPLSKEGFKIFGTNFSDQMIKQTRELAKEKEIEVKLEKYSLLEGRVDFENRFSLVLLTGTWFGMFCTPQEIKLALKNIFSWLKPGGKLVVGIQSEFDMPENPHILSCCDTCMMPNEEFIEFNKLEWMNSVCVRRTVCYYEFTYHNELTHHSDKKSEIEVLDWKLYKTNEMELFLQETGFVNIKPHKAFEYNKAPGKNDKIIIFEGQRPLKELE